MGVEFQICFFHIMGFIFKCNLFGVFKTSVYLCNTTKTTKMCLENASAMAVCQSVFNVLGQNFF